MAQIDHEGMIWEDRRIETWAGPVWLRETIACLVPRPTEPVVYADDLANGLAALAALDEGVFAAHPAEGGQDANG